MKNRGFAAVAILSLALGIGANTTIFTFLNAIFLQPLPVEQPQTLAAVVTLDAHIPGYLGCSYPNYRDYRDRARSFSSLLLYGSVIGTLTGLDQPQRVVFQLVSGNFFQTLGVKPAVGRAFLPEEDSTPGAHPVAVISYALWMRQFGGDAGVLGRSVEINSHTFQIVGVAPRGFEGLSLLNPAAVWVPTMMYDAVYPNPAWFAMRHALTFSVAGRLKPGVSRERAGAELESLNQALEQEYPRDNEGRRPKLIPLSEAVINHGTRDAIASSGTLLAIVAGLILLIACANVANLLLARAAGRNREIAVRLALGAGRWRLIRQLLAESTVLAVAGGALGLVIAHWASRLLWALRPPIMAAAGFHIGLDGRVLGYTLGLSLLTGFLFGLMPALRATNPDLATDLKERAGPPASGFRGRHPRSLLVASQVALCVVALIGAGLFVRSLSNAAQIDPGFDADHLGMVTFDLASRNYSEGRGREFERNAIERVAALPGVAAAAISRDRPLRVSFARNAVLEDDPESGAGRVTLTSAVSPGYLRAAGIALVSGRDFSPLDTASNPRVVIVNEAAAGRYWPNQDPLGKRVRFVGDPTVFQAIGVARNANYLGLGEPPQALFYTSLLQQYEPAATLMFRTRGEPEAALERARLEVQTLDPNLLLQTSTARSMIDETLWAPRLSAGLLSVFGVLGLVLATLGVYGVVSYSVNQRVREIGLRMALGATAADVQVLILRQGLALVTVGVVAGLLIALGASRAVQSLLLVTSPRDSLTFVLVPSILVLVAILACWGPAHRATRIDPATALRDE